MIVGVAMIVDGVMHTLPAPKRHHNIIHKLALEEHNLPIKGEQGFIDENNNFLTREAALIHATENGQISPTVVPRGGRLYSEDLW